MLQAVTGPLFSYLGEMREKQFARKQTARRTPAYGEHPSMCGPIPPSRILPDGGTDVTAIALANERRGCYCRHPGCCEPRCRCQKNCACHRGPEICYCTFQAEIGRNSPLHTCTIACLCHFVHQVHPRPLCNQRDAESSTEEKATPTCQACLQHAMVRRVTYSGCPCGIPRCLCLCCTVMRQRVLCGCGYAPASWEAWLLAKTRQAQHGFIV